jgi:arginine utilization regulatory protein
MVLFYFISERASILNIYANKLFEDPDEILIVSRKFEILFHSRYNIYNDKNTPADHVSFFDIYPMYKRNENSSIYRTLTKGVATYNERQSFKDKYGNNYVTKNITLPLYQSGIIVAAIEISRDLTTVGSISSKPDNTLTESSLAQGNDSITFDNILTDNDQVINAIQLAKNYALNGNPTLIYGETGTGKELFAQAMINYGGWPKDKIVLQNCAAIPKPLYDSTLFGTVKGSYTGAETRKGLFDLADKGIFFLDELSAMPYDVQGKLLRVLQDGSYRPIGSTENKISNVKIIAAMNIDPQYAIKKKTLRMDLFYRIANNYLYIPPLRERPEDIITIGKEYIKRYNSAYHKEVTGVSDELMTFLQNYSWPGNVRELSHVLESMISVTSNSILQYEELPVYINKSIIENDDSSNFKSKDPAESFEHFIKSNSDNSSIDLNNSVANFESEIIRKVLLSSDNITDAAKHLGIPRQTLRYKMNKYNIKL